jgi:hemerythrin
MNSFEWREEFSVGVAGMDDTHHEFVECVDAMLQADDAGLQQALRGFIEHARSHFGQEDRDMQASAYESAGCHVDEHAAVLRSAEEVRLALEQGKHQVVRAFAQALADWFPEHARVMDLGLARWLVQRRLGGSPVVIRPRASVPA